jgi:predicted molibdopterin-dependent oxidoreductase YjgC
VKSFGAGVMSNSIPEIRDLDFLFIIGSNTTEAHPIIAMEMKLARQRGAGSGCAITPTPTCSSSRAATSG